MLFHYWWWFSIIRHTLIKLLYLANMRYKQKTSKIHYSVANSIAGDEDRRRAGTILHISWNLSHIALQRAAWHFTYSQIPSCRSSISLAHRSAQARDLYHLICSPIQRIRLILCSVPIKDEDPYLQIGQPRHLHQLQLHYGSSRSRIRCRCLRIAWFLPLPSPEHQLVVTLAARLSSLGCPGPQIAS